MEEPMSSPFKTWLNHLPSAREKFFVLRHEGKWKIRYNGQLFGPYLIPGEAVLTAMRKASRAGQLGGGAQVFVQAQAGEFKLAWTYGLDPEPVPD